MTKSVLISNKFVQYEIYSFHAKKNKYAMIIPTLNEGEKLKSLITDLQNYLALVDIILVDFNSDDGSTDKEYLKNQKVSVLLNSKESGLGTALRVGFDYALNSGYESIITIDSNGKDNVNALESIIEKLESGYDFVQASRFMKGGLHKNTPLLRILGIFAYIVPMIALGCGYWYSDPTNGFKGINSKLLKDERVQPLRKIFRRFNMQYYLNYIAAKLDYKVVEVPAQRVYPDSGEVPTKIHGLAAHIQILSEVYKTITGSYNP
jgi:dolichol-phosphate mannosyltransferase